MTVLSFLIVNCLLIDVFTFDIRPHPNNSFSIIILVNGIRDLRLNACCEHKHRPGHKVNEFGIMLFVLIFLL